MARAPPGAAALALALTGWRRRAPRLRGAEVFEDHMAEWLLEFQKYLSYENLALLEADPSKESVVDQVRAMRSKRRAGCSLRRTRRPRRGGHSSKAEQRLAHAG